MTDDLDPALHWLSHREYAWGADHEVVSTPRVLAEVVAETREELASDPGPEYRAYDDERRLLSELRLLSLAEVLEECAARLRLAVDGGHPAGSLDLAALAGDLADDLYRRTILRE